MDRVRLDALNTTTPSGGVAVIGARSAREPSRLSAVLALQRSAGNRATAALLRRSVTPESPRKLTRCAGGVCTCGGRCGAGHLDDEQLSVWRPRVPGSPLLRQAVAPARSPPPASLRSVVGSPDYYRMRANDFRARNPHHSPPSYYMGYGDKYARRFVTSLRPRLSSAGQHWLDCTFRRLQSAMEDRRDADPAAFAALELNDAAFLRFAYNSHPAAYTLCGICAIGTWDELQIAATPDFSDSLLSLNGITQILEVLGGCAEEWFYEDPDKWLNNADQELRQIYSGGYAW
jgi:hypothetical protein